MVSFSSNISLLFGICCSRKFTDITSNENNFLLVVYGITTIVYSVIKNEFRTKCSGGVLKHEDQNERTDCAEKQQKHCISTKSESGLFTTTNSMLLVFT